MPIYPAHLSGIDFFDTTPTSNMSITSVMKSYPALLVDWLATNPSSVDREHRVQFRGVH